MTDDLVRWLIGTIGVGSVAGAVYWLFDFIKTKLEARVYIWCWYQMDENSPTLHLTIINRTTYDLILTSAKINTPSFSFAAFAGEGEVGEISMAERVGPGPPFAEVVPSRNLAWPLVRAPFLPRWVDVEASYTFTTDGKTSRSETRSLRAIMA